MYYLVTCYGYEDGHDRKFQDRDKALQYLKKQASKWCRENDVDIDDISYCDSEDYFSYGVEGQGVCVLRIYEVPEFESKVKEFLWMAKREMDRAEDAADEYEWTLTDCGVSCHTSSAKDYINEAIRLLAQEAHV